jgi:hypothetical protein
MTSAIPAAVRYLRDVDPRLLSLDLLGAMKDDCGLWLVETATADESYGTVFNAYRLIDCVMHEHMRIASSPPQGSEVRTPG